MTDLSDDFLAFDPNAAVHELEERTVADQDLLREKIAGLREFAGTVESLTGNDDADAVLGVLQMAETRAALAEVGYTEEIDVGDDFLEERESKWIASARGYLAYLDEHPSIERVGEVLGNMERCRTGIASLDEVNRVRRREALGPILTGIQEATTGALRVAERELEALERQDSDDPLADPALNAGIEARSVDYETYRDEVLGEWIGSYGEASNGELLGSLIEELNKRGKDLDAEMMRGNMGDRRMIPPFKREALERVKAFAKEFGDARLTDPQRATEMLSAGINTDDLDDRAVPILRDFLAPLQERYQTQSAITEIALDESMANVQRSLVEDCNNDEERGAVVDWIRENFVNTPHLAFSGKSESWGPAYSLSAKFTAPDGFEDGDRSGILPQAYNVVLSEMTKMSEWLTLKRSLNEAWALVKLKEHGRHDAVREEAKKGMERLAPVVFMRQMLEELVSGEEDGLKHSLLSGYSNDKSQVCYGTDTLKGATYTDARKTNPELLAKLRPDEDVAVKLWTLMKSIGVQKPKDYASADVWHEVVAKTLQTLYPGAFRSDGWHGLFTSLSREKTRAFREAVGEKRIATQQTGTDRLAEQALEGKHVRVGSVTEAERVFGALRDRLIPHLVAAEDRASVAEAVRQTLEEERDANAARADVSAGEVERVSGELTQARSSFSTQLESARQEAAGEATGRQAAESKVVIAEGKLNQARTLLDDAIEEVDGKSGWGAKDKKLAAWKILADALDELLP